VDSSPKSQHQPLAVLASTTAHYHANPQSAQNIMTPETIAFKVPSDLLAAIKIGVGDLSRNIRLMAAIAYFQEKKISLSKAAQLARMNFLTFHLAGLTRPTLQYFKAFGHPQR
jgi:citrate lyase beta subunit